MRILVVSNLYPPHHQGGYELRCAQVVNDLRRRGHTIHVVTSDYRITESGHDMLAREESINGVPVSRFLRQHRLDPTVTAGKLGFLEIVKRQRADLIRFAGILDQFKPDVVSWWNLEGVTKAMLRMPHDRGIPSVVCIDDNWMIRELGADGTVDQPFWFEFWACKWGPRPLRPLVRLALARSERRLAERGIPTRPFGVPPVHVCFISEFWRYLHEQAGLDVRSSEVIYGGIAPEKFLARRAPADYAGVPLRLLYAGYVDPRRGLHTIVEALSLVPAENRARMHLSVASGGPVVPDDYVRGITSRVAELGLSKHVTFLGRVPHTEMPAVFASHDVLVFASTRNEGMPMVMMEAMCAGCAVPNTGSGGSIELSEKAATPLFPKDHPFALARLLTTLERDRALVAEIAQRGQQTVLQSFTIDEMLNRTCDAFERVAGASRRVEAQPLLA